MPSNQALIRKMKKIFRENGGLALKQARQQIISANKDKSIISQSLRHFSKITLHNTMPVFPALIVISCKAVGGNVKQAIPFGKAIVLITGAADLHDDVIDKSTFKGPKPTVFGKFGETAAILAGDILLAEGLTQLHNECDKLPKGQGKQIRSLISEAILEISMAETLEASLKARLDLSPNEFYDIIRLKAVVPELTMKIGAIVGGAEQDLVEELGEFGRSYGVVSLVSDECADIFDPLEVANRLKNGCLPLPLIYALQNLQTRKMLLPLLSQDLSDNSAQEKIIDLVFETPEVQEFLEELNVSANCIVGILQKSLEEEKWEELKILLSAPFAFFANGFS